jgi:(1->4)-alpha-D-glucan 1-alpha-D-glucosylmutase
VLALPAAGRGAPLGAMLEHWQDGAVKLLVTAAGLRARAADEGVLLDGEYLALETETVVDARVMAFARISAGGRAAIVIAPHLASRLITAEYPVPLADRWRTSRVHVPKSLAALTYRDVFTGAEVRPVTSGETAWLFVGQVLKRLPVSLLVAVRGTGRRAKAWGWAAAAAAP